jgi:RND superfamily putative drug exporter
MGSAPTSVVTHRAPSGGRRGEPRHRADGRGGAIRGLVTLAVLAVWLVVGAFGGMAQGRLSEVQENDAAAFLPASAESTRAAELARAFSDTTTLPALVVVEARPSGSSLTAAQQRAVAAFAEGLADLPLGGAGERLGAFLTGPVVAIPAPDGQAVLVPVPIDGERASESVGEEDRVVTLVVDALRDAAGDVRGEDLGVWVTGPAGAVADLVAAFGGIDGILLVVAVLVVLGILVLVYRSPILPFAVILTALFGLTAASLVVYRLASGGVLDLNGQSQGILFILVVGAATDYSLLLVARYREELTRHESVYVAMRVAWRRSLAPISASAGTVVAGLLCLLLSDLSSNASLGPVASIGIVSSYLAALTLLPALLLVAGRRSRGVFWPKVPRPAARALHGRGDADAVGSGGSDDALESGASGLWHRLAGFVARHDRPVWVATALVLVGLTALVPMFRAEGTSDSDVFLTEVESVAGQEVLAAHFDAGQAQPIVIVVPEADLGPVLAAAAEVDGVARATPLTTVPGGEEPLVVQDRVLVNAVTTASADSRAALTVASEVRAAVHEASEDAVVGGAAAERLDAQETSVRDLQRIIPAVLAVILMVLVLLLRAVVAPVVILLANVLSFGASIGVAALVFNEVFRFPGSDPGVVLYAFVFLVALGIDYTIFLMTRVREESLERGTRRGVRYGLAVTGGVITSAGIVLAATFGALSVLPILFLAQISFLVAFGVLLDAMVVRSLLVPALVHDLGRRSWWPWGAAVAGDRSENVAR